MAQIDRTLSALADPTRRRIVDLLAEQPRSVRDIGTQFSISAPALSRHLKVLRDSGVITDQRHAGDNRVRVYRLEQMALINLQGWLTQLEQFWGDQLQAFKQHAERDRPPAGPNAGHAGQGGSGTKGNKTDDH